MRRAIIVMMVVAVLAAVAAGQFNPAAEGLWPRGGAAPAGEGKKFAATAVVSDASVRRGGATTVAVVMTIADKFHLYGPAPGGKIVQPMPLKVTVGAIYSATSEGAGAAPGATRPADMPTVGAPSFSPTSQSTAKFAEGVDTYQVYYRTAYAYIPVSIPVGVRADTYVLPIKVEGQICDDGGVCIPVDASLSARLTVGDKTTPSPDWAGQVKDMLARSLPAGGEPPASQPPSAVPQQTGKPVPREAQPFGAAAAPGAGLSVFTGLGLALLSGIILNIMPCVLPVIPLKLLSIVQQAGESRRRFITLGLAFIGGMLLFFVGVAIANAVLKLTLAYTLRWGDLFQNREFVVFMTLLLVALAVNLFGAFTVTVPGKVAGIESGQGHWGAVGSGMLTAVLSTPCSFAFLTAAFAWAQAQPLWLGSIGILCIGLGMAAPYALITAFPRLLPRIPRAGRWTELFKQGSGFVMLLVAVWLLSTRMEDRYAAWVAGYAVVLAMCLWAWGSWVRYDSPARRKWGVRIGAAVVAAAAGVWMLTPAKPLAVTFEPFDAARIAQARADGHIVLIDFTAAWCLTCKTVEELVYNDPQVAQRLHALGVVAVKGDVTTKDLPAGEMLYDQLHEPGVPVSVIFPPGGGAPIRLYGVFSKADLLKALQEAGRAERK